RLSDYWVFVSDSPFDTSLTPAQQAAKSGVWSSHQTKEAGSPNTVPAGASGRYVMVQLDGTGYLALAEVQVNGFSNLALNKTATQSSDLSGSTAAASRAVDGNTDGTYDDGSVSHTNSEANAWWKVDLGSSQRLTSINVFNRTDSCCSSRLSDYWVFVSDSPFDTSLTPAQQAAKSGVWSSHQTKQAGSPTTIPASTSGRYIMVQLDGTGYLALAEVQATAEVSTGNTISNNYIHRTGVEFPGAVGVFVGYAQKTTITHNQISDLPYSGISFGWGGWHSDAASPDENPNVNSDNTISYNLITNVMGVLYDGGAIYTNGSQGTSYASGLTISHNVTYGNRHTGNAFYQDRGSRYVTLDSNVQYQDPGNFNGGCSMTGYITAKNNFVSGAVNGPGCRAPIAGTMSASNNASSSNCADVAGCASIVSSAGLESAYKGLLGVAVGKTATQSSTLSGSSAAASRAVDGNTDGNYNHGAVSHTDSNANAWWKVDLGSSQQLSTINIFNRTDCCSSRLSDYWVFVSDNPFNTNLTPAQQAATSGVWSSHRTIEAGSPTTIPVSTKGRYVMVQLNGTGYLALAEVQAFTN
ncbi:galactose-binding domain-containing protein, partial [Streptomyces tubercidicus]